MFVAYTLSAAMKKIIVYSFGLLLAAMATGQFASFGQFVSLLTGYGVPHNLASVFAMSIMALELSGAAGILLTDKASAWRPLFISLGVIAALLWATLTMQALSRGTNLANTGFFGTYVPQALSVTTFMQSLVLAAWGAVAYRIASDRSN